MNPKQARTEADTFWSELRRRGVVRAGGVYVAAAFVVLQLGRDRVARVQRAGLGTPVVGDRRVPGTAGGPGVFVGLRPHNGRSHANGRVGATGKGDGGPAARACRRHCGFRSARCSLVRQERVDGSGMAAPASRPRRPASHPSANLDPNAPITAVAVLPARRLRRGQRLLRTPAPRGDHHAAKPPDQSSGGVADVGGAVCHHGQAPPRDRGGAARAGGCDGVGRDDRRERQRADLSAAAARAVGHAPAVPHLPTGDEGHPAPADRGCGGDRHGPCRASWGRT